MKNKQQEPKVPVSNEGRGEKKNKRQERHLTDDGRESSNGKVRGVEGKDYVILSSGLGIDESEVTG
ncbi:hypothetical protein EPD60_11405 [Flaviaesturariibacter flavus]|uniref:Uncharacterized protein n=1 Tax=Flaviaesturariibacter flavus TaxID=2502780 RepID=A0A4R1BC49_9BACT|nr:hypothetical protein [Flaviaesturariibacter flavus]TCJ14583.1 hypothetical protein EPD60_11405 [Flaviaesturariibacter flavus]